MHIFPKKVSLHKYLYPAICKRLFSSNNHYITAQMVPVLYSVRPLWRSL